MLFGFRGIRLFQVLLSLIALGLGVGAALAYTNAFGSGDRTMLIPAVAMTVLFLWLFSTALRIPTSFVTVTEQQLRVRFAGFVDTLIANDDVIAARLVPHPWWAGIGVRSNMRGTVALATAWGQIAELELRRPVRVWVIPGIWRLSATNLRLSVREPHRLVERFPASPADAPATTGRKQRRR